ncbi:MAG: hypothetical protein IPH20_00015 [Bacteroidales bacterium]|nr:hypothetical protein [Bacteroidales bacterium]
MFPLLLQERDDHSTCGKCCSYAGNVINVEAGTFTETVLVNKSVTVNGAGYTTKVTSVSPTGNIMTIAANDVTIVIYLEGMPNPVSSATRGSISIAFSNANVTNVKSSLHQFAMFADNSADITGLTVENTELLASGNGFQVEQGAKVATLSINGGSISGNLYGFSSSVVPARVKQR